MTDYQGDPRDEIDAKAGGAPPNSGKSTPKQEVIGPTDSLQKSALDVGLLRLEMDVSMEHALRHRRNIKIVVEQIREMALHTDAAAARCIYALPRAEKAIIGPSIGLATIISTAWGNCTDSGWWIRTERAPNNVVVCGGTFFDLETNRRTGATVTRRISGKSGRTYSDDMVAVTIQAATSIAQRNAILKGVPTPVWWPVYEEALVVVRGTEQTLPERRAKMIQAFAQFGVEAKRVLMAMGVKEEREITLDQMVMLRGMYEQLRDGIVTSEEMFDPRAMTGHAFDTVVNPLEDAEEDKSPPPPRHPTIQSEKKEPPRSAAAEPAGEPKGREATQVPPDEENEPAASAEPAKPLRGAAAAAAARKAAKVAAEAEQSAESTQAKEPAKEAPPKTKPRTSEQYLAHAREWIAAATPGNTTPSEFDNRWRSERTLRGDCGVMADDLDEVRDLFSNKLAELKAAAS